MSKAACAGGGGGGTVQWEKLRDVLRAPLAAALRVIDESEEVKSPG